MDIHAILKISGLTRGQVDQLISRYSFQPQGSSRSGLGRTFTKADAFKFAAAGELSRLGLNQPTIANALSYVEKIDRATFEQLETFPGCSEFSLRAETAFLAVSLDRNGEHLPWFLSSIQLSELISQELSIVVVNATAIAERVEKASHSSQ